MVHCAPKFNIALNYREDEDFIMVYAFVRLDSSITISYNVSRDLCDVHE